MTSKQCGTLRCGRPIGKYRSSGKCDRCYRRDWTNSPDRPRCIVGRVEPWRARDGEPIEACEIPGRGKGGMCSGHGHRLKRHGHPLDGPGRGSKGIQRGMRNLEGRYVNAQGYVRLRTDRVGPGRWVLEHRHVMEQLLGRELYPDETVHHKNTIKTDNRPENLELWCGAQPTGQRAEDALAWARMIIDRYEGLPTISQA